jgi:beta-lactamase class A
MRKLASRGTAVVLALAVSPLAAAAPTPVARELLDRLRTTIERQAAALDGVAGVYVEDLATGAAIALRAEQVFPQASAIKLPILWELLARADEGAIDLDARARRPAAEGMGGLLDAFSPELELSARDLAALMIAYSDNGATNALIDRLGMERVTARMASLGLGETKLRRKMLDGEGARAGRENVSTPRQMAALVSRLHGDGEGLSAAGRAEARRLLGIWSSDPFRAGIGEGAAAVFEKPGELPGVRTSVALVELPGRAYAVAIATAALADDVDGDAFVTRLSREIYRTFDRLARMNEVGRFVD